MGDIDNHSIRQIFQTMDYGDVSENATEVTEWLKNKESHLFVHIDKKDETPNGDPLLVKNANNDEVLCNVYIPEDVTIETVLKKIGETKNAWAEVTPIKQAEIMFKFGNEIKQKQSLFTQLEVTVRGILSKDVKKSLALLIDYLQYYSSFSCKNESSWDPEALVVAIISDENTVATFGQILGPCLAAGYRVILQTVPQLSLVATLLIEIGVQVGIPEDTIRLIPGSIPPNVFFINPKVTTICVFDDLYKEKYQIANNFNKKLLHFYSSGIPMLVFDNCDLDSTCHGVINAVWGHKGMLPWSVRNVYIQENIFDTFIQKLKHAISQIKVGKSDKKNIDISSVTCHTLGKLEKVLQRAENEGVEVFQPNKESPIPSLLIGGNIFHNNVINEDVIKVPIVTLTAFRTINEAVNLANNTRHGLAASVWTENTSLIHEIMEKLKVSTIWINSHGLFSAEIPISPYKSSGNGYFGGTEGFYEFIETKTGENEDVSNIGDGALMEKAINEAKKAQSEWFKLDGFERKRKLQRVVQEIQKNNDKWILSTHDYVSTDSKNIFTKIKAFNIITTKEPYGAIAIEEADNEKLIIAALIEGNCVIVLNHVDAKEKAAFYTSVARLLPKGVLSQVPLTQEAIKIAALHKELNLYIGEKNKVFGSLPLKSSSKFKTVKSDDWSVIRNKVTLVKNIWFNKGQSFN